MLSDLIRYLLFWAPIVELNLPENLQKPLDDQSLIDISGQWHLLGPFQIGTRGKTLHI